MANARKRKTPMASSIHTLLNDAPPWEEENGDSPRKKPKGQVITGEEIQYHDDGDYISVKRGTTYEHIYDVIRRLQLEQNTVQEFVKQFDCRPWDGAFAAAHVLKEMFGVTVGQPIRQIDGSIELPKTATIKTGPKPNDVATIPWGALSIPMLDGSPEFHFGGTMHKRYGPVFTIMVKSPKKHKAKIDELFARIEEFVRTGSIYRGKALAGADELEFLDFSGFNGNQIVFSDRVEALLENGLFSTIRNADLLEANGISVKRAALLYGPYGTGKTSIGIMLAQEACRHGWTFILARAGEDNAQSVVQTAMIYQPAVVVLEDFDVESSTQSAAQMAVLLETLDGATNKGARIITVATTNHIEKIHPGLLRPGRLDFVVEIGILDAHGIEKLIKRVVGPDRLADDVDYEAIFAQMDKFEPSFVRATVDRAKQWAINRTLGSVYVLTTADLVGAAQSLHEQQKLMEDAKEITPQPTIDVAQRELVKDAVSELRIVDGDGDTHPSVQRLAR